ncbi:MAG: FHA domain-containing protein [Candidatus Abyssobacteria bacterium SURF_5]|uniref:FHA domain-containing protein n=1 Tax=Abyssobacteria bacterium (strain SURF_5) TaxID=2093360 RepID=A0A3A4N7H2_ABYX5|nr:MAG: FHA domain-containing protein [Candidatus Abyssubacteria bacterium SURF_5]
MARKFNIRKYFRTAALGFFWLILCSVNEAGATANHSLIFVVDSSKNMAAHIGDVKDIILSYTDQSQHGDYLGVVSFSQTAKLLTMKKIAAPTDRKSLAVMLDVLAAEGDTADIDQGVVRALEEVAVLKRRGDKNIKGIFIVAASRLPDDRSTEHLDRIMQDVSKWVSQDEWYIQYCFLGGIKDETMAAFVANNNGISYDIDALKDANETETLAEIYKIAILPQEVCHSTATDVQGAVLKKPSSSDEWLNLKAGEAVGEDTQITVAEGSRLVLAIDKFGKVGFAPGSNVIISHSRRDPTSNRADVHIGIESGSMWMKTDANSFLHVHLKEKAAELSGGGGFSVSANDLGELEVVSFFDRLSMKADGASQEPVVLGRNQMAWVKAAHLATPAVAAEADLIEEWKNWSKVIVGGEGLASVAFTIPEVVFPAEEVTVGPLESGNIHTEKFLLRLVNIPDMSKLKLAIEVAVALPEGISITTALLDGEEPDSKELVLKLDGSEGFSSDRKEEHKGFLKIAPEVNSAVTFQKISVPITIITSGGDLIKNALLFGIVAVGIGLIGFTAMRMYRKKEIIHARPHRVIGRLIIIDDPTRGRTGSINLEEIGTKSSRLSLIIGRDRNSEIRLKHASVQPSHCLIEANLVEGHLVTLMEPIASAVVRVNNEQITSKIQLNDGDKISIGDFSFQFEDTQYYKKVEVVYSNGRRIAGILDVAGMDAEGFKISPTDAVSPSERARVKFSDIRTITFYRRTVDILAQKPRPQAKHGLKRVELMFKRGDTIGGYLQREYSEGRRRFIELLPLDHNSDIDYIVVDYSSVVEKKTL